MIHLLADRTRALAVNDPDDRELTSPCFPQIIFQLGHPEQPVKRTPRRPLADIIETSSTRHVDA